MTIKMLDNSDNSGIIRLWEMKMKDLEELLAQKRRELARLQREVDALTISLGLLRDKPAPSETTGRLSKPKMAAVILQVEGTPLHAKEIAKRMEKQFRKSVKPTSLGVLLYRYAQRGKHFYKVQGVPNTYGLIEMKTRGSSVVQ